MRMPIEKQIKYFIEHHGVLHENWDLNLRGGVQSGSCYRELREQGLIDDKTITVTWNTDGANPHKKSKKAFWPFMAVINEAKYKLQRAFIILLSLYYGHKKPPMNSFMDWIMSEWARLERDGVLFKNVKYKVRVVIIATDTVARPLMRNTTQFNGEYGCDFCFHPGKNNN